MTTGITWDGADLLDAFTIASDLLSTNRTAIDAMNVFPVPDGDTGINMSLTMATAVAEARAHYEFEPSVGSVARWIAHGALLGAQGNSGVILSQICRGFASEVDGLRTLDGPGMARGFRGATTAAYEAVLQPVEGTMLTVIRMAAEAASAPTAQDPSLAAVLEAAVAAARHALIETPTMLETLRCAGVVDAGGQGVVLVLQGLLSQATGTAPAGDGIVLGGIPSVALVSDNHDSFGYCTNFLVTGERIPVEQVRAELGLMGQSAVIVGDAKLVKVHIHTELPGQALDCAGRWGTLSQIKIDDMNEQVTNFAAGIAPVSNSMADSIAILAVANGPGIAGAFQSFGVSQVIEGGRLMSPGMDELLRAINADSGTAIILLPNSDDAPP